MMESDERCTCLNPRADEIGQMEMQIVSYTEHLLSVIDELEEKNEDDSVGKQRWISCEALHELKTPLAGLRIY